MRWAAAESKRMREPDTSPGQRPACGNGEEAIERLHGLIPGQVVPRHQEVAVEAGQQFRLINDARKTLGLPRCLRRNKRSWQWARCPLPRSA